jgi:hypothetical protein
MYFTKTGRTLSLLIVAFAGFVLCAQGQRTATATPTVVNGFVVAITVTDGGAGYTNAPAVNISGGGGTGAMAVTTVFNGAVDKVIVQNAGNGYTNTPTVVIAAPPSPKPPFSDGLVAYYPFNENADDASGNGNDGTVNGAVLTTDRFGNPNKAYSFDGKSFIIVSNSTSLASPNQSVTLSVWVRQTGWEITGVNRHSPWLSKTTPQMTPSSQYDLGSFRGGGSTPPWGELNCTLGNVGITDYDDIFMNKWAHVVMTFDVPVVKFYVNGLSCGAVLSYSASQNALPTITDPLYIGRTLAGYAQYFNGELDDIRIYNRALSDVEVADLYAYEAPEQPSLTINVKTVQVTMHVKPTKKYQLEASLDMNTWNKVGDAFTATTSEVTQEFNAIEVGRFFRLSEVQ